MWRIKPDLYESIQSSIVEPTCAESLSMASGKFCESWKRYSADFNMHFIKFTESNNEFFQPFYHNKFAVDIDSTSVVTLSWSTSLKNYSRVTFDVSAAHGLHHRFCDSRNDPKIYYRKAEKLYNLSAMRQHMFLSAQAWRYYTQCTVWFLTLVLSS